MITFYAAVGSYRLLNENDRTIPCIQKLGKYHPVSVPEFIIWSSLLWEVLTYDELKQKYEEQIRVLKLDAPEFGELLSLLIKRKLILRGIGYTGRDALYQMLSDAFVVPYHVKHRTKAFKLLRLLLTGRISFTQFISAFKKRGLKNGEKRVFRLVSQTPLSTAELIRCFDLDIADVSSSDKLISALYHDSDQKHIANEVICSEHATSVLEAVSNLYLKQRIILEVA